MKRNTCILAASAFLLQGCLTIVPLKGSYDNNVVTTKFDQPFDMVWTAVMETVISKNLDVNVLEKQSGLVSSYQSSYIEYTTYEKLKKTVELIHPATYIVTQRPNYDQDKLLEKVSGANYSLYFPFKAITGRWKIHVKPIGEKQTSVSVVLGGFEYQKSDQYMKRSYITQIYSLKNFEKGILSDIAVNLSK